MTSGASSPCHICGAMAVRLVNGFEQLGRATSDCRPWPAGGTLGVCGACGAVQRRVDAEWRAEAANVYSGYQAYRQSIGGAEQHVFDPETGTAIPRSQKILRWLLQHGHLFSSGRMLDVGCGNGAMLRAFAAVAGQWELNGFEPHLASDREIYAIPGVRQVWTGALADTGGAYDLLTLSHSLEHVENPIAYLAELRSRLSPSGRLLIQVPYFPDSPYDLLVTDHCTHFTVGLLDMVLRRAGYTVEVLRHDVIVKELTAVARPAEARANETQGSDPSAVALAVETAIAWLRAAQAQAFDAAQNQPFGLFGTAVGASWLFGVLGDRVQFFVDEDPARVGTRYFDRAVVAPRDLQSGATVYMALPHAIAERIVARIAGKDVNFCLPPEYTRRLNEVSVGV